MNCYVRRPTWKSRAKIFPNLKSARNLPIANGLKIDLGERNWGWSVTAPPLLMISSQLISITGTSWIWKKKWKSEIFTSPSGRDSFSNSIAENRNELNRWVIDSAQIIWAESSPMSWINSAHWAESIQLISIWAESIQLISIWAESIQLMGLNDRSSENGFHLYSNNNNDSIQFDSIKHTRWQPWDSF